MKTETQRRQREDKEKKREEKTRREKKQDTRRDKMKREMEEKRRDTMKEKMKRDRGDFFPKNVSRPSNPPDELAQNVSKKIPFRRIIPPFFLQKCRIWPFLNFLHDSNSIFWARRIKS